MVKVILTQDVPNVGKAGDLTDVAAGYMRNYLTPKRLTVLATGTELKSLEARRAQLAKTQQKARADAEALAKRLEDIVLTFQVRVGEQNRLFGSITSKDIAEELARTTTIMLDRRDIELDEALKTLGSFAVPVRLMHDVKGTINVTLQEAVSA